MAVQHLANNLPQISTSSYASQAYNNLGQQAMGLVMGGPSTAGRYDDDKRDHMVEFIRQQQILRHEEAVKETKMADPKRRLVKVVIIDPDDKVPLGQCILHNGSEKLTDLTDQELFFEIDIKNILDKHNAERIKIVDKTVKERKEHLEPVKVRDLRMVVVTVAQF